MRVADRLSSTYFSENKRPFHNFGNNLVIVLINAIFNSNITDIMIGYRAFSKRFVKTISVMLPGFQIKTELTVSALEYRYNVVSVPIQYRDRSAGSQSILNTYSDGSKVYCYFLIWKKIISLYSFFNIFFYYEIRNI